MTLTLEPLVWTEALRTDNELIDRQHRELIARVNRFEQECNPGVSRLDLAVLLDDLVDYSRSHFEEEELLFQESRLEEIHKKEHQSFVDQLIRFQREFGNSNPELDQEMLTFLQQWLVSHIQRMDINTFQSLQS